MQQGPACAGQELGLERWEVVSVPQGPVWEQQETLREQLELVWEQSEPVLEQSELVL